TGVTADFLRRHCLNKNPALQQTDLFHAGPQRNWTEGHSALMSLCWQIGITLQTGSKSVTRSGLQKQTVFQRVPSRDPVSTTPSGAVFPGLKDGQRDLITVVTAVTCSLAGRQNEPPHPTATEVSCS
ncbi:hypothetical protein AMECASPLE_011008, partial [Ameca splendens]